MLKGIIAITGKPGLYKLLSRGRNSLIVEDLATGKRTPSYPHEKVISLADISMYTNADDVALADVLDSLHKVAEGKPVDIKSFADEAAIRDFFGQVLPDYDRDRVYTTDIRKLIQWYNQLLAAGITEYKDKEDEKSEEKTEE